VLNPSDPLQNFHHKTLSLSILWSLVCAGLKLDCAAPCYEVTEDEDHDKSSDMFRKCDEASRLDGREHTLHLPEMSSSSRNNTHNNKAQTKGPSTLGVSVKH
jgi:hypothetical protein